MLYVCVRHIQKQQIILDKKLFRGSCKKIAVAFPFLTRKWLVLLCWNMATLCSLSAIWTVDKGLLSAKLWLELHSQSSMAKRGVF